MLSEIHTTYIKYIQQNQIIFTLSNAFIHPDGLALIEHDYIFECNLLLITFLIITQVRFLERDRIVVDYANKIIKRYLVMVYPLFPSVLYPRWWRSLKMLLHWIMMMVITFTGYCTRVVNRIVCYVIQCSHTSLRLRV